MSEAADIVFMKKALGLARKGWGRTHPNPMVGAVIEEDGEVVAEGYHAKAGEPHAEIVALRNLSRNPSEKLTLYSTLEPCCTHGKTPPCTEAIIESGIRRVVVGATDPNPGHSGKGFEQMRRSGIEVVEGILQEDCEDLNLIFNHWIGRGEPFIAGKIATTIDGRIATRTGNSKWITGEEARADVMCWRRLFPAIAVGAGTVLADNPRLTSRFGDETWCPVRFVFDTRLRTVREPLPRLYCDEFCRDRTIVVSGEHADEGRREGLSEVGVKSWILPENVESGVSLRDFRQKCGESGIGGVFFEGGASLLSSLLDERLLDYLYSYRAPILLADKEAKAAFQGQKTLAIGDGFCLKKVRQSILGRDQLMRGFVVYPKSAIEK